MNPATPNPAEREIDEILRLPDSLFVQDADSGMFVEYDMQALRSLIKTDIRQLLAQTAAAARIDECERLSKASGGGNWRRKLVLRLAELHNADKVKAGPEGGSGEQC